MPETTHPVPTKHYGVLLIEASARLEHILDGEMTLDIRCDLTDARRLIDHVIFVMGDRW